MANKPTTEEKLRILDGTDVTVYDPNYSGVIRGKLTSTNLHFTVPGYTWRIKDIEQVNARGGSITLSIKTKPQKS